MKAERSHLPFILCLAVAARLAATLYFVRTVPPLANWGYENVNIALALHAGHGFASPFTVPSGPTAFMTPLYPAFLALLIAVFGPGPHGAIGIIVVQMVFSLANVWLVMYVARGHFGTRAANFAGFICAICLPMLLAPLYIWDTALSALLVTAALPAAEFLARTRRHFALAGFLCGVAVLVNPALLLPLGALLGWSAWKARVVPWAAALLMIVAIGPWTIRNSIVMHAFIPLRSNVGYELWEGNLPGMNGDSPRYSPLMIDPGEQKRLAVLGEVAYMREKGSIARASIAAHPSEFLRVSALRVVHFWSGSSKSPSPMTVFLAAGGLAGLFLIRRSALFSLYGLPLLVFPLPYYMTHPDVRFQFIIDPLLAILTAHACAYLLAVPAKESAVSAPTAEPPPLAASGS